MAYKKLNRINRRMELIWFHVMEKAFFGDARVSLGIRNRSANAAIKSEFGVRLTFTAIAEW